MALNESRDLLDFLEEELELEEAKVGERERPPQPSRPSGGRGRRGRVVPPGDAFMRTWIVAFTLPSEYLKAEMVTNENVEVRRLRRELMRLRVLRKNFYTELSLIAAKFHGFWVLLPFIDSREAARRLNPIVGEMNRVLRDAGLPERRIVEMVEVWIPRDVVRRVIAENVEEVKLNIEKLMARVEAREAARSWKNELRKLKMRLAQLEKALLELEG